MRTIFSTSSSPSNSAASSFSESLMDQNIKIAQSIITKWDSQATVYVNVTPLFHDDRSEAKLFIDSVNDLQSAMRYFISDVLSSNKLVRAQSLMQIAMRRLEKEFFQILTANQKYLNEDSVSSLSSPKSVGSILSFSDFDGDWTSEDEQSHTTSIPLQPVSEVVLSDLKAIADCMISTGYGKECVKIYTAVRKSIVDEALRCVEVERLSFSQNQKTEWELIEAKIKNWSNAVKFAVKYLFYGERILSGQVFSSIPIRDACFGEISKEGAIRLFRFPELIARRKQTPEKLFRLLDLYESIVDILPEIESIFSFEKTKAVRSQAHTTLSKLSDSVRKMLFDFETAIHNNKSKSPVSGGGIHPLARYVMNYISLLADYSGILSDIFTEWPLPIQTSSTESYFGSPDSGEYPTSPMSVRLAWIILVLLCKIEAKSDMYREVSLSYIFLANNLQYIITKVKNSNLRHLIGKEWIKIHENKVRQYAANYERVGWSQVFASLPKNPMAEVSLTEAKERFKRFNSAFEEVYQKQTSWIVTDRKLREDIKVSVGMKLRPAYQAFYRRNKSLLRCEGGLEGIVRFSPDDLGNYASDLLYGMDVSARVSSSLSSVHSKLWWSR